MKRKAIAGILAASFMLTPALSHAQQNQTNGPPDVIVIGPFCQVLIVIGIYEYLRLCDERRHPSWDGNMTSPPLPGYPPLPSGTNSPPAGTNSPQALLVTGAIANADCSAFAWPDTNCGGIFTNFSTWMLQRSDTADGHFQDWLRFNRWTSTNGVLDVVQAMDGTQLTANYCRHGQTNELRLPPLPQVMQFFRALPQ